MPKLNVYKSKGNTVYLCGLTVFKGSNGIIRLTYDRGDKKRVKNDICHLDKGSNVDKFFNELIKFKE